MIKILQTADLHLDSPLKSLALRDERLRTQVQTATRTTLRRLVQFCIDEEVRALLIAGDLFDGKERSAKTAAFLIAELERLGDAGVSVFYIKGNHDAENPVTGALELPANVHVFDGRGGKVRIEGTDVWIHGVSFRGRQAPESLLPKFGPPEAGAINIGMLHTSLSGAAGHDPYAPCSVEQLRSHGFDYWALGHVHKRQIHSEDPWVVMPGIPQGRDIGEAGPKSATLLTIEKARIEIEEVRIAPVEFRRSRCDVSGIVDDEALRKCLRTHFRAEAALVHSDAAILRLTLFGQTERAWQIRRDADLWTQVIRDLAEESGILWVEKIAFDLSDEPKNQTSVNAVAELSEIMRALRQEDSFRAAALSEFEQIVSLLPPDRRHALVPDDAASADLFEELSENAIATVTALMKGGSE